MTTGNTYTIDLHTHSIISHDGAITPNQYEKALKTGLLDFIGITDHNDITLALELHKQFGNNIIVGEEIMTTDGEIIGLYLQKVIPQGRSAIETIEAIHEQGGLVYVPHPFERIRKGIQIDTLIKIISRVDIFEVFNGRAIFRGAKVKANQFARKYNISTTASSDAHAYVGLGYTYSEINAVPTKSTLVQLLQSAKLSRKNPPVYTLLSPTVNKIRRLFM